MMKTKQVLKRLNRLFKVITIWIVAISLISMLSCAGDESSQANQNPACDITADNGEMVDCLVKLDLKQYFEKPLTVLLSDFGIDHDSSGTVSMEPPGTIAGVNYSINDLYISVILKGFQHQPQHGAGLFWDFELLKKEKVFGITIFFNDEKINEAFPTSYNSDQEKLSSPFYGEAIKETNW